MTPSLAALIERVESWLDCKIGIQFNVPAIPEKEIRSLLNHVRAHAAKETT